MYRKTECGVWDDPKVKQLPALGKLLFTYLFTNRHSHVSGLYYLPREFQALETGIDKVTLDSLWDTLAKGYLAFFDPERDVVFVPKMLKHQGCGHKHYLSAISQAQTVHQSPLIAKLYAEYPILLRYPNNGVSQVVRPESGSGTESGSGSGELIPPPIHPSGADERPNGQGRAARSPDSDPKPLRTDSFVEDQAFTVTAKCKAVGEKFLGHAMVDLGAPAKMRELLKTRDPETIIEVFEHFCATRKKRSSVDFRWFFESYTSYENALVKKLAEVKT